MVKIKLIKPQKILTEEHYKNTSVLDEKKTSYSSSRFQFLSLEHVLHMQLKFKKQAFNFEYFCLVSILLKIKSSFTTDMKKKVNSIRAFDKWALIITRLFVFIDARNNISQRKV